MCVSRMEIYIIKQYCDKDDYLLYDKNSLPKWVSVLDYKILGQHCGYKAMCPRWSQIFNRRKTGVFHRGKLYLTEEMTLIPEFDIYR